MKVKKVSSFTLCCVIVLGCVAVDAYQPVYVMDYDQPDVMYIPSHRGGPGGYAYYTDAPDQPDYYIAHHPGGYTHDNNGMNGNHMYHSPRGYNSYPSSRRYAPRYQRRHRRYRRQAGPMPFPGMSPNMPYQHPLSRMGMYGQYSNRFNRMPINGPYQNRNTMGRGNNRMQTGSNRDMGSRFYPVRQTAATNRMNIRNRNRRPSNARMATPRLNTVQAPVKQTTFINRMARMSGRGMQQNKAQLSTQMYQVKPLQTAANVRPQPVKSAPNQRQQNTSLNPNASEISGQVASPSQMPRQNSSPNVSASRSQSGYVPKDLLAADISQQLGGARVLDISFAHSPGSSAAQTQKSVIVNEVPSQNLPSNQPVSMNINGPVDSFDVMVNPMNAPSQPDAIPPTTSSGQNAYQDITFTRINPMKSNGPSVSDPSSTIVSPNLPAPMVESQNRATVSHASFHPSQTGINDFQTTSNTNGAMMTGMDPIGQSVSNNRIGSAPNSNDRGPIVDVRGPGSLTNGPGDLNTVNSPVDMLSMSSQSQMNEPSALVKNQGPLQGFNDAYASTNDPYASTNDPYASTSDPYVSTNDPYAFTNDPYASTSDPYVSTNDPFAFTSDPYASTNDPYALTNDPYASPSDPYVSTNDPYASTNDQYASAMNSGNQGISVNNNPQTSLPADLYGPSTVYQGAQFTDMNSQIPPASNSQTKAHFELYTTSNSPYLDIRGRPAVGAPDQFQPGTNGQSQGMGMSGPTTSVGIQADISSNIPVSDTINNAVADAAFSKGPETKYSPNAPLL